MSLNLDEFSYELPTERIAEHPPKERGASKLLVYRKGDIQHLNFKDIVDQLPKNVTMVFNDTKVIPARIILQKHTGARIEVFLLEPLAPSRTHEEIMITEHTCTWKCMIGNAKKWKVGTSLKNESIPFSATRTGEDAVRFEWQGMSFSDLLTEIGKIPLPPYIHRDVEETDQDRYQTVYSKVAGAVAAPSMTKIDTIIAKNCIIPTSAKYFIISISPKNLIILSSSDYCVVIVCTYYCIFIFISSNYTL